MGSCCSISAAPSNDFLIDCVLQSYTLEQKIRSQLNSWLHTSNQLHPDTIALLLEWQMLRFSLASFLGYGGSGTRMDKLIADIMPRTDFPVPSNVLVATLQAIDKDPFLPYLPQSQPPSSSATIVLQLIRGIWMNGMDNVTKKELSRIKSAIDECNSRLAADKSERANLQQQLLALQMRQILIESANKTSSTNFVVITLNLMHHVTNNVLITDYGTDIASAITVSAKFPQIALYQEYTRQIKAAASDDAQVTIWKMLLQRIDFSVPARFYEGEIGKLFAPVPESVALRLLGEHAVIWMATAEDNIFTKQLRVEDVFGRMAGLVEGLRLFGVHVIGQSEFLSEVQRLQHNTAVNINGWSDAEKSQLLDAFKKRTDDVFRWPVNQQGDTVLSQIEGILRVAE